MANALRFPAADAVEKAQSGRPGLSLGMANVAAAWFTRHLKYGAAVNRRPKLTPMGRAWTAALASAELVRVAQAGRARIGKGVSCEFIGAVAGAKVTRARPIRRGRAHSRLSPRSDCHFHKGRDSPITRFPIWRRSVSSRALASIGKTVRPQGLGRTEGQSFSLAHTHNTIGHSG
jgi:Transketolase, thiamine diphosphate binding domain